MVAWPKWEDEDHRNEIFTFRKGKDELRLRFSVDSAGGRLFVRNAVYYKNKNSKNRKAIDLEIMIADEPALSSQGFG